MIVMPWRTVDGDGWLDLVEVPVAAPAGAPGVCKPSVDA